MFIQIQSTECAAFCIHIIGTSIFLFLFFSLTHSIARGGENDLFVPHTSTFRTLQMFLVKMIAFCNLLSCCFETITHRESIRCIFFFFF